MAEYIEREATVELLRSLGSRDYRRENGTIQDAIKMISFSEYTPSADVVSVVRCKDCKNYRQNPYSGEDDAWCMCWSDWIPTDPDDFCSYGELRSDE